MLLAIGKQVGFWAAFLAIGMPLIGKLVVELGLRTKKDKASENCVMSGSFLIGSWLVIAIPTWCYIIYSFATK